MGAYPQYKNNPLIIAAESYGGKYAPAITYKIMTENANSSNPNPPMPLKGMAVGDGLSDPATQILGCADLAYNFGIADPAEAATMREYQKNILHNIETKNWPLASKLFNDLVDGPPDLFQNYSGSPNYFDVRISYTPVYGGDFSAFLN